MLAMLALIAGAAQLYNVLPVGVQRYLEERKMLQSLENSNRSLNQLGIKPTFVSSRTVDGVEMIDAFIDFDNPAALERIQTLGVHVGSIFDDFATAQIPVNALEEVSATPGILNVEISKLLELCTDSTLSVTRAGLVINGTQNGLRHNYDGTGVIVGVIDSGFDYQHLAFRSADDTTKTRIVRVYDLLDSTAHPVVTPNTTLPGRVFMGEQIDTLTSDGTSTHGTHVASIAAGMHVNGYGGMAPGADIVLCVCRNLNLLVSEVDVVNCIRYIYSYADSVNKPCVINLSISTLNGAHDGKDRISKAVAQRTGPGRIFVISAGNTGSSAQYSGGPSTLDKPFSFLLGYDNNGINDDDDKSYYYPTTTNEIWTRGVNERPALTFHIYDKMTQRIVWESTIITLYGRVDWTEFQDYFEPDTTVNESGYMYAFISQNTSGKFEATTNLFNLKNKSFTVDSAGVISTRYQIGVTIYPPVLAHPRLPDSCYVDMWICVGQRVYPPSFVCFDDVTENGDTTERKVYGYYAMPNNDVSICTYAVHDSVISAGAYVGRNSYAPLYYPDTVHENVVLGKIIGFSAYQAEGCGPTGKALPTVCAPGYDVVAAGSRYSYFAQSFLNTVMEVDGNYWGVMSGTSMSAPTVAGIIAQWLQANPELSPGNIKDVIAHTAIKDEFTMDESLSKRYGPNGKIDAMAGIRYILDRMPMEYQIGDVDGDGEIDVNDLTMMIAYILGLDSEGIVLEAADLDDDGVIDVNDVTSLISFILNQE